MKLITFAFVLQFIITCWTKTDIMHHFSGTYCLKQFNDS